MCLTYACNINVEKDIVCYKVYLKCYNNILLSPYQRSLAPEFNTVAKTDLGEVYKEHSVNKGFHSFANFCDSMKEAEDWHYSTPVVVKCIIPKGAKCYVGQFEGKVSYCSDSIILVEQIETILPNLNFD